MILSLGALILKHFLLSATAALLLTTTSANAMDECLNGWWEADYFVLGEQFMDTMGATGIQMTGAVYMRLSEPDSGEYFVYALTLEPEIPDIPPMKITLNGGADFGMDATEGVFLAIMGVFNYVASVYSPILGEMDIPFDHNLHPFGGGAGGYTCTAEDLVFTQGDDVLNPNGFIKRWVRIDFDPRTEGL